ncbi:TetR/AcrR family transcriptional regulator [Streptomyces sp. L2]|uniref:TetR/AcrR family transcriptional regulator n=1 Tax=Streptomyces sp. L2 TaxID=2162665 RepID=UPI001F508B64|nr:TetR/AcrR family transcriptional regulator [Streptomyces sp. L2]
MPGARESLLDAAAAALARRAWSAVRMVDVAAAAGVSRQTLYNEFGSKDGLARALVRREADGYLAGVDRALAGSAEPRERLAATAEWTASAARGNPLVRAMLTGCWSERLPAPALAAVPSASAVPAQRRADRPLPSPGDFVRMVRDRAVAALTGPASSVGRDTTGLTGPASSVGRDTAALTGPVAAVGRDTAALTGPVASVGRDTAGLTRSCELAVRLGLSCVAAPPADGSVAELVLGALAPAGSSGPTPTAGGRSRPG